MSDIHSYSSDVAFTPAVKAIQARKGSRNAYARVEQNGGWRTEIDEDLTAFLAAQDSMFLATATAAGQKASSRFWTRTRWRSPITAATGNTSPKETSPKTRRPTSS